MFDKLNCYAFGLKIIIWSDLKSWLLYARQSLNFEELEALPNQLRVIILCFNDTLWSTLATKQVSER